MAFRRGRDRPDSGPAPDDRVRPAPRSTASEGLLYGTASLDEWPSDDDVVDDEPWASFVSARHELTFGETDEAIRLWTSIAEDPGVGSRHVLQAWTFLRMLGTEPPPDIATRVCGAVAEVAVGDGHDVLVAYIDGAVRYLNHSGSAVVVDDDIESLHTPRAAFLGIAQQLADVAGRWEEPSLPPLPVGHTRIGALTPDGRHVGQGPTDALLADRLAGAFVTAATDLLVAVTDLAQPEVG